MNKHLILLVDDDILILNTLKKRFETWDINVFTASTPEEAKKILSANVPDLVMLDLLLTKDDGSTGILDFMRSQKQLESVPVIVLSNLDKPELKDMLLNQMKVKEYVIKGSITLDDLFDKVVGYLEPEKN